MTEEWIPGKLIPIKLLAPPHLIVTIEPGIEYCIELEFGKDIIIPTGGILKFGNSEY